MQTNSERRRGMRRPVAIVVAGLVLATTGGLLAWRLTRPPTSLPQASCGLVITNRLGANTTIPGRGAGVLRCFDAAARACKAASIAVTELNVDVGTGYVFTLEPGGTPCRVTELSQGYSANFGGSTGPIIATSCLRRAVTTNGVMLRCAGQDLLIPAKVGSPGQLTGKLSRRGCGSAVTHQLTGNTQILSADRGALLCFSTAVRRCRSASIEVVDMGVDTGTDFFFTVEPGYSACLVHQESQSYSANFGGQKGPITASWCHLITVGSKGVVLGCPEGHVLIPAMVLATSRPS